MWEHFHNCITTGATPLTSAAEGRAALELVRAVVSAGETGKPVRPPVR
jgi:predicted dehydrogenase